MAPADDALTQLVPANVGFYAELRNGADVLTAFSEPQLWTLLSELAGQPAGVEETTAWREQIKQTVKMEPAEAIRTLFAQRVAFAGHGPGQSQDAVVLCRPVGAAAEWPPRWQAKPLSGYASPTTFQLFGNMGVSVVKDALLFGDLLATDGMFPQAVTFAAKGKPEQSLAADEGFKRLLARGPKNPEGLLFLRLTRGTSSAPATAPATALPGGLDFPGPLRGATQMLLALRREARWLNFSIIGDTPALAAESQPASAPSRGWYADKLPARSVIAWEGDVSLRGLVDMVETLPERNVLRAAFKLQQQQQLIAPLLEVLEDHACIALGWVELTAGEPASQTASAPASQPAAPNAPLPAIAALLPVRNAAEALEGVTNLIEASTTVLDFLALAGGGKPLSKQRELEIDGLPVHLVDLSRVLSPEASKYYELQLCWTVQQNTLVIATHLSWLKAILAGGAGKEPTLPAGLPGWTATNRNRVLVQTGMLADAGQRWLAYITRAYPHLLDENWWRRQQTQPVRLGIDVVVTEDQRRLSITRVNAGGSSDGFLFEGDVLLGTRVKRFATTQPINEMKEMIEARPHAAFMDLVIERNHQNRIIRVPLPNFDPVRSLRRLVAIGSVFDRLIYADAVTADGFGVGQFGLELQPSRPAPQPQVTSAPAPAPASGAAP